MSIEDTRILSKYNIIKKLGEGGQGSVYLASKKDDGARVAIKKIEVTQFPNESLEQSIGRASLEFQILKKVSVSPNCDYISCYIEHVVNLEKKEIYLVMEYIDGLNLLEYVKGIIQSQDTELVLDISYKVIKAISLALQAIHKNGVLHRDIKPENIVVENRTGIPKLVDFGTACLALKKEDAACKSVEECCLGGGGTYSYLSPERILFNVSYPQSDIWSLGATMYSLLTGEVIWFDGASVLDEEMKNKAIVKFVREGNEPKKLNSGIELLDKLVNGMTAKDISERITIDSILDMLKDVK